MDLLGTARIFLLMLAMIAFFYLARRLKGILLPALILIGTGFGLIMLDLIVRALFGGGFLFDTLGPRTSPLIGTVVGYIGQIAGVLLLLLGFYRINRVVVDITERQRLEEEGRIMGEALAESEGRYRRFFDDDLSGNFISTPEGRILVCNPSFANIFGYESPEEVLSADANSFYENPEARRRYLQVLTQKRKLVNFREKLWKRDGSAVYITSTINGEFNEDGELVQIQGYVIDETERVRAEQTMRESVEQLRKVFEEGPVGMTLFNLDGEILRANDAFSQMIGYSEPELKTLSLRGITHPDDLLKDELSAQRLLSGGITSYRTEKRYITKSGDIIWALATKSLVRESGGTPLHGIGIFEDISARKRGEEELERSLSLLRATLESTADGILVVNDQGHIVSFNQKFLDMWRIPESVIASGDDSRALSFVMQQLADPEEFIQKVQSLYAQPEAESYDAIRFKDGRVFERYSKPQKISGKTVGRVWSFRDLTEREQSAERLRRSEEEYHALFEDSKDAVFISTPDGRFVDINQAGVELFGFPTKADLMRVNIGRDLYVNSADRVRSQELLAKHGYLKDYEVIARRLDGRKLVLLETTTAVRNERGHVVAYRGILRDVTEQKRLEAQLLQAQKMESIGTLAGGIAHDFNNILAIVLGYVANLDQPDLDRQKFAHILGSIKKALARGTGLTRQLLTFARKTGGVTETVAVNETVYELSKLLAETFPKTIKFEVELGEDVPTVLAESSQFQQTVLNLCLNARDAIEERARRDDKEGILTIITERVSGEEMRKRFSKADEPQYVGISVIDTGIGMDETVKSRMFEPFFSTKAPGKGTGLGLAVVYGVVKALRGFIDVESSPGIGTTVRLYFPARVVTEQIPFAQAETGSPFGNGEIIMLVEDEEMLLDLLQTLLEDHGYRVLVARDGQQALDVYKLHQHEVSVVLSDMGLPKLGGWEVFQRLKKLNPNVKCILASGFFDPDLRDQMISEGAKDFVEKPYIPHHILSRIREIIDRTKPENHN